MTWKWIGTSVTGQSHIDRNEKGQDYCETRVIQLSEKAGPAHAGEIDEDPLDEIVRKFNERWFQGWSATPEEQRVKFIHLADSIKAHPDFDLKYKNNPDSQNRNLAFEKIFDEVMLQNRRKELELYKLLANDQAFRLSMQQSLQQVVG